MESQEFIVDEVCDDQSLVLGDEEAKVVGSLLMLGLHGLILFVIWVVLGPKEQVFLAKADEGCDLRDMD